MGYKRVNPGMYLTPEGGRVTGDSNIGKAVTITGMVYRSTIGAGSYISGCVEYSKVSGRISGLVYKSTVEGGHVSGEVSEAVVEGGSVHGVARGCTIRGTVQPGHKVHGPCVLVGSSIAASCLVWTAWLISPGVVSVGCQTFSIEDWLTSSAVPWDRYCLPVPKSVVQSLIRNIADQERLMKPWDLGATHV
jgi:hypothetical protein